MNGLSYKLSRFLSHFPVFHYKKGEILLRAEDEPSGAFFIKKGFVRDYSISSEGQELTLIIFKPNDFFPMRWVMNDAINDHYFEAMTDVEVWRVPKQQFLDFIGDNSDMLNELTKAILVRLGGLMLRMEHMVFGNASQKVASILAICADRFGKKEGKRIIIQVPMAHRDIANLLGLTRETTSIEIKKLERKNIIAYQGKNIVVRNVTGLKRESFIDSNSSL